MSERRMVRAAIGVPLAVALTLTAACLPEDAADPDGSAASPSAANGIDKLKPTDAFKRATDATLAARSVRVRAKVKDAEAGTINLDFTYAGRDRAKGTMQIGDQKVEMIRIGKEEYQKGNKAFLKETGGNQAVSTFSGMWMKTTQKGGSGFGALSGLGDLEGLLKEMEEGGLEGWTTGKPGNTAGTPSVPLNGAGEQIHLAAEGPPYVLRMSDGTDYFDFLSYDKPVTVKRPPARLVVDTSG
ncbi:hypothetical protein [Actinomadura livida]|uniref:Lipoprotein n=1 Tax=Actinomadura livida TaxID=79909 RepID=A0A7W7IAM8_9ACTN|nr:MULTISPECIES: hypothetical protein [Actinomadura]MBB4773589.1 hypothetical protein [Actinomadura catellatispora]GGU09358.1 hypothetical protein GCM10010208_37320 [Actinomadura livida]